MVKLILRYVIAVIMIPVGVVLGVGGLIQNHLRRRDLQARQEQMRRQLAAAQAANESRS